MDYKILFIRFLSGSVILSTFILFIFYLDMYINILVNIIYILIFCEVIFFFKENKQLYLIFIYLFISLILSNIYFLYNFEIQQFLLFIFLIITFDSIAYLFGSIFGKKKIFTKISKNKTYFGFFSGFFMSFILSYYLNYYFSIYDNITFIFFSFSVLALSFFGDVLESYFKRLSKLKDSSYLIPGHGGFFDRFDSFVCSIYFLSIFNILY